MDYNIDQMNILYSLLVILMQMPKIIVIDTFGPPETLTILTLKQIYLHFVETIVWFKLLVQQRTKSVFVH